MKKIMIIAIFSSLVSCSENTNYLVFEIPDNYQGYLFVAFMGIDSSFEKLSYKNGYSYTLIDKPPYKLLSDSFEEKYKHIPIMIKNVNQRENRNEWGGKDLNEKRIFKEGIDSIRTVDGIIYYYTAFVTTQYFSQDDITLKNLFAEKEYQVSEFIKLISGL